MMIIIIMIQNKKMKILKIFKIKVTNNKKNKINNKKQKLNKKKMIKIMKKIIIKNLTKCLPQKEEKNLLFLKIIMEITQIIIIMIMITK